MNAPADQSPPPPDHGRRKAMAILAVLLNAVAATLVGIPVLGYFLGPLLRPKQDEWIDLGPVSDFPENQTRRADYKNPASDATAWDGDSQNVTAYVHRLTGDDFRIFAVNCTHLGCPVSWFPESGLFMCPCHGGVYYSDGQRASGPPPRGLYQYEHRIENGRLSVLGGHLPTLGDPIGAEG